MPTIDEELRAYAVKVASGRASVSDESRIHQIGQAIAKELPVPEAAAPVIPAPESPKKPAAKAKGKGK